MSFTNTIMILGVQGQGKTTLMTKFAYEEAVQFNRRILTNYKIKGVKMLQISFGEIVKMLATQEVPKTIIGVDGKPRNFKRAYARAFGKINKELTVDDIVKDTVMCFDEIHVGAHAYDFLSKGSRTLAEFSSQIRKRGILLLGSAQFFSQVAKQVRIQMNTIINVTKIDKTIFNISVLVPKDSLMQERGLYTEEIDNVSYDLSYYFDKFDTTQIIHYSNKEKVS